MMNMRNFPIHEQKTGKSAVPKVGRLRVAEAILDRNIIYGTVLKVSHSTFVRCAGDMENPRASRSTAGE